MSDVQEAVSAYINASRSARYWEGMFNEAQRTRDQRQFDMSVAETKRLEAMAALLKACEAEGQGR